MISETIKSSIGKLCTVVILGVASASAFATVHVISNSNFTMLAPSGDFAGDVSDVSGSFDDSMLCDDVSCTLSGSMTLATNTLWFGAIPNWHDIRVFTEGSYTFDTNCTGADIAAGITDCGGDTPLTLVVGPGQLGMHGLFDWRATLDIDIAVVWDFFEPFPTTGSKIWNLASTDGNGDGIPGIPIVELPFPGLSANFNLDMDPPIGQGVVVSIDVVGGVVQLCREPSGCAVTFIANTTLAGNAELESLEWTIDGAYGGSGEDISPVLTLGSHTIEVLATTTTGETNTDAVTVTLIERILPTPLPDGARLTIGPDSYFTSGTTVPLIEGVDGLVLGDVVPALPSSFHPGSLDGNSDEQGGIVESYEFLGNTGTFWTASPIVDLGGGLVDMSGWDAAWDVWPSMGFDNPIGSLTVVGDSYVLEHSATVTGGPFPGAISYTLHLEGKVQLPNEAPDCSQAAPSLDTIWPPNHKLVPVTVEGVTDTDSDPIVITVNSIYQDEPVNTYGDGNFVPDGQGIGTDTAEVRAERSGTKKVPGNGRFYHIEFSADDGQGGSCAGEVTVAVPRDRNTAPVDDGALYDSAAP